MSAPSFLSLLLPLLAALIASCATPQNRHAYDAKKVREAGLVEVSTIAPDIRIHLRYGTNNNLVKHPLYPANMPCLVRPKTLQKLLVAQRQLRAQGYGLLIWDAYRPPQTQQDLWDAVPIKDFVANPAWGWSGHCCGISVDVTLVDLNGQTVAMPTDFDHIGPESWTNYKGNSPEAANHLKILRAAMFAAGFDGHLGEWWHYEDPDYLPLSNENVVWAASLEIELPKLPPHLISHDPVDGSP